MEKTITALTIFTFLLFAVSTATIASDPVDLSGSAAVSRQIGSPLELATIASDPVDLSGADTSKPVSESESDITDANEQLPASEQTQTFNVRSIESAPVVFSQRHSFDRSTRIPLRFIRRHPCRKFKQKFMIPTKKISYGNDMILSDKTSDNTVSVDLETIGDRLPTEWLEFKHKYGHRHHHYHHDKDQKRDHKGGFMKRVRKFLKHTFN